MLMLYHITDGHIISFSDVDTIEEFLLDAQMTDGTPQNEIGMVLIGTLKKKDGTEESVNEDQVELKGELKRVDLTEVMGQYIYDADKQK